MSSLKAVISEVASGLSSAGLRQGGRLIQIETTKKYLELVSAVRTVWLKLVFTQVFLVVGAMSGLVAFLSLPFLLPLELFWQIALAFGLSASLCGICVIVFMRFNSQENWMEFSQANEMLRQIVFRRPE